MPVELRLNQAAHRAAARLASLPDCHPLHKAIRRCTSRYPCFHCSPLHKLFHCFPDLHQVATVCHTPPLSHAGELPFELVVADTKDEAQIQAAEALQGQDTCVFVKGCVVGLNIGAAAVAAKRDGRRISCRVSLGPAALRQVHDGVLAAMTLALCAIMGCPQATRASILVSDRTAVTALTSHPDHPLVRLFLARLSTIKRCSRPSLHLRIVWAPLRGEGEHEHLWCQAHDDAAVAAGGSESSNLPCAVLTTLHNLKTDRKVLVKQYNKRLHGEWKSVWEASRQGSHISRIVDDAPPGPAVLRLYRGLSRRQCSILSQLRSGHSGLNAFLAQIRAIDSPLCLTCATPETVSHFLFTCRQFTTARHAFRTAVEGPLTLRNTVGNAKSRAAVLDFVDATGRFEAYWAPQG